MIFCDEFLVEGKAILAPDAEVELKCSDVDASDAGRDESGYMHRMVVRRRVRSWSFRYSFLTREEYAYLESLFAGLDQFRFTFPNPDGSLGSCTAYCSGNAVTVQNLRTGIYKNYGFNIIEC